MILRPKNLAQKKKLFFKIYKEERMTIADLKQKMCI